MNSLRIAVRSLAKSPGFTAVIVLTLALGIGANTAIFSFFNGILLRPLPYDDPERAVMLKRGERGFGEVMGEGVGLTTADFVDLQAQAKSLSSIAAFASDVATLTGFGEPNLLFGAVVTPEFFTVLGARAAHGRTFTAADTTNGAGRLAMLDHTTWQNVFGGNPDIVGRPITLNGVTFTVVGIMPAEFELPRDITFWVSPAGVAPESTIGRPIFDIGGRGGPLRSVIGRLAPGVTVAQAESEIAALVARLPNPNNVDRAVHLMTLRDQTIGSARLAMNALLGCVALVLLIACLNIGNLMLSRATTRQREIGIRLALGAGRWRIARQLLSESLVLAVVGGAAGVALSWWGVGLLVKIAPEDLPQLAAVRLDGGVLAFAFGISVLTGIVTGLAPVLGTGSTDLATSIKTGDRGGSGGALPRRLRAVLVGSEVALSLVLLVAAGLLMRSFAKLQAVSWGFEPEQVAVMRVAFAGSKYEDREERRTVAKRLLAELETKPGFDSVALSFDRIGESWIHLRFTPDGFVPPTPEDTPETSLHIVSPGYFHTLGITLVRGRSFAATDTAESTQVVIVDAAIAERYFPNGDALGKRMLIGGGATPSEIIGVVGRVKSDGPEATRLPDIYRPYLQSAPGYVYVFVRTSLDVATVGRTIQEVVRNIDAGMPTTELSSMTQVLERPAAARRFPLVLMTAFSVLALALAGVGIYAVTAYSVAQRTRELGVRMALGAQPRAILTLVLRQSFRPILSGIAAGLGGAVFTAFFLIRGMLFGVEPFDAPTFFVIPFLLAAIALIACLIPARRATRVDPLVALRAE